MSTRTVHDIENPPVRGEPPNPCCTCTSCCGCKMSWRDIIMFSLEGVTGGTSATSAVIGALSTNAVVANTAYGIAAVLGVVTLVEGGVHLLWRRDAVVADLHRVGEEIRHDLDEMTALQKKTDEVAKRLQSENEKLGREKQDLLLVQSQFERARRDLDQQVLNLTSTNQKLILENKTLTQQIQALTQQVQRLQEIINAVKEHLAKFTTQNSQLKSHVGTLSQEVSEFGKQDDSLKLVLSEVDKELDIDVADLAKQVTLAQQTSHEIFGLLSQQIQKMQVALSELKSTETKVDKDEDEIRARSLELQEIQRKLLETQEALKQRQMEFEKISLALLQAKTSLSDTLQKLSQTESKISNDNTDLQLVTKSLTEIASHLDILGDRVTKDVATINSLSKKLSEQEDQISNL